MTLCEEVCPTALGLPPGPPVLLDLQVHGMGWTSAVGITQMAHRRMLTYIEAPERAIVGNSLKELSLVPVFVALLEVRKDRVFPVARLQLDTAAWSVYIDNLTEDEICTIEDGAPTRITVQMNPFHSIRNPMAADGKLDGNSCIAEITARILRDALDGKEGRNLHWKTYYVFDLVTIGKQLQNFDFIIIWDWSIGQYWKV